MERRDIRLNVLELNRSTVNIPGSYNVESKQKQWRECEKEYCKYDVQTEKLYLTEQIKEGEDSQTKEKAWGGPIEMFKIMME